MPWPNSPVHSARELIQKHHESVWVQRWCYSTAEAYSRNPGHAAPHTPMYCSKVLSHNLHLSVASQFWHHYASRAETQRWHTVYWTKQIMSTHSQPITHTIKTKNDICVNHCIHTCNAIWTLHKDTHKVPGSHAAIHIQAQKPLCLTLHYLWASSKGTHARLEMWIQTGGLHDHLYSKFSPASQTIGDIQFFDNQLTEYSVIQALQFRWDGVSRGFQTRNGPHYS